MEENCYKEHGKYTEYYIVEGDAGFSGTNIKDYYRVRSKRNLDEKEVAAAVKAQLDLITESMWDEMYDTARDIIESREEIDEYDESCQEYIESYVDAYYDKVTDCDLRQKLKESGFYYSEKINDYLTIQKLDC